MDRRFIPCPGCSRHIRAGEAECPFCSRPIAEPAKARILPKRRLGRAAVFTFGAALALTAAGCGDSHGPDEDAGREPDAGYDAGSIAPPYGIPPDDGGIAPLYGGAPGD